MWKSDTCLVSRGAEESARHLIWGACGKAGALGDCYGRSDPPRVCAWPILARLGLLLPLNRSWCFRHKTFFEVGSQSSLTRSPVSSKVDTTSPLWVSRGLWACEQTLRGASNPITYRYGLSDLRDCASLGMEHAAAALSNCRAANTAWGAKVAFPGENQGWPLRPDSCAKGWCA